MLCDGEWWACQNDGHQLIFDGTPYRKVCDVDFIGYEGQRILGIFRIHKLRNLAPYRYELVFVSEDLMPGHKLKNIAPVREHYGEC